MFGIHNMLETGDFVDRPSSCNSSRHDWMKLG
jgi:hypothetical protein